jgi:hypothetical protein
MTSTKRSFAPYGKLSAILDARRKQKEYTVRVD